MGGKPTSAHLSAGLPHSLSQPPSPCPQCQRHSPSLGRRGSPLVVGGQVVGVHVRLAGAPHVARVVEAVPRGLLPCRGRQRGPVRSGGGRDGVWGSDTAALTLFPTISRPGRATFVCCIRWGCWNCQRLMLLGSGPGGHACRGQNQEMGGRVARLRRPGRRAGGQAEARAATACPRPPPPPAPPPHQMQRPTHPPFQPRGPYPPQGVQIP